MVPLEHRSEGRSRNDLLLLLPLALPLKKLRFIIVLFLKNKKTYLRGHLSLLTPLILVSSLSSEMLQPLGPVSQMGLARIGDDSWHSACAEHTYLCPQQTLCSAIAFCLYPHVSVYHSAQTLGLLEAKKN